MNINMSTFKEISKITRIGMNYTMLNLFSQFAVWKVNCPGIKAWISWTLLFGNVWCSLGIVWGL